MTTALRRWTAGWRILLLLLHATSCEPPTPEAAVSDDGGKEPIICHRPHKYLSACRDAHGLFWVCDKGRPIECMRPDEPLHIFSVVPLTPEKMP